MGRKAKQWLHARAAELTAQGMPAFEAMDKAVRESRQRQRINRAKVLKAKAHTKQVKRDRKRNAGSKCSGIRGRATGNRRAAGFTR